MLGLFASIKHLLKPPTVCTDGVVFRIHYRVTVLILLSASILLSCRQYFGDPIYCLVDNAKIKDVVEKFCWIHSTFVLPHAWNLPVGTAEGKGQVAHPGIDKYVLGQDRVFHAYYQWVALVLLLQAIFFYLPRYVWKMWEKGTIRSFTMNLQDPFLPPAESEKSCEMLSHALHNTWGQFSGYFRRYIICELLSLINVSCQMWLLNVFLGGVFTTFGTEVLQWTEWHQNSRTDPLARTFPRMTKCKFYLGGYSGDIQKVDALCILPLNVLNEKIFIFLWFWMVMLIGLSVWVLVYRVLLFTMPLLRRHVLAFVAPHANKEELDILVGPRSKCSDWFILYLLSKNIDPQHYNTVIRQLAAFRRPSVWYS